MKMPSMDSLRPVTTLVSKHQTIFLRVALLFPFAASIGLVTWSLHRLQPVLRDTSAATDRLTHISSQIDDIERFQMRQEKEGVEQKYRGILAGYANGEESVRDWLADVREKAAPLAFAISTDIGDPVKHEVSGETFTLIPVRIELQPSPDVTSPKGVYQRVIEFCRYIAAHPLRADVSELTVAGSTGEVGRASLTLHLWARNSES